MPIRLQSNRGKTFVEQAESPVDADGTFAASLDRSDIEVGTLFLVEASRAGSREPFTIREVVAKA